MSEQPLLSADSQNHTSGVDDHVDTFNQSISKRLINPRVIHEGAAIGIDIASPNVLGDKLLLAEYDRRIDGTTEWPDYDLEQLSDFRNDLRMNNSKTANPYFHDAIADINIPDELLNKLGIEADDENDKSWISNFLNTLSEAEPDVLLEFLHWNSRRIDVFEAENGELLRKYAKEFYSTAQSMIINNNMPLDKEQLTARMSQVGLIFEDIFTMEWGDISGSYDPDNRVIRIAAIGSDEKIKENVHHELWHHVSGQTLEEVDSEGLSYLQSNRMGLRIITIEPDDTTQKRLDWLNEAITEQLTQLSLMSDLENIDLSNLKLADFFNFQKDKGVYLDERKMTNEILGYVGTGILLGAYFEDHIPEAGPGQRAVLRRRLQSELISGFDSGLHDLRELDRAYHSDDKERLQSAIGNAAARSMFLGLPVFTKTLTREQSQRRVKNQQAVANWRKQKDTGADK